MSSEREQHASRIIDEAGDDLTSMAENASRNPAALSETASTLYAQSAELSRDALDEMPATMSDAAAAAERVVLKGRQRLDRGVRSQPIEALLLAGAIGYLVGWATSRS